MIDRVLTQRGVSSNDKREDSDSAREPRGVLSASRDAQTLFGMSVGAGVSKISMLDALPLGLGLSFSFRNPLAHDLQLVPVEAHVIDELSADAVEAFVAQPVAHGRPDRGSSCLFSVVDGAHPSTLTAATGVSMNRRSTSLEFA